MVVHQLACHISGVACYLSQALLRCMSFKTHGYASSTCMNVKVHPCSQTMVFNTVRTIRAYKVTSKKYAVFKVLCDFFQLAVFIYGASEPRRMIRFWPWDIDYEHK